MVRRWSGGRGRGGDGVNGPSVSVVWCVRVDMTDRLRMVNKVFCHICCFFWKLYWNVFGCILNDRIPSRWASVLRGGICDDPANPAHGQMGILVLSLSLLRCA